MSHDIRTPMNAIIGFTSLAATHMDPSSRRDSRPAEWNHLQPACFVSSWYSTLYVFSPVPMNAIIGFTSLAATHMDNPEQVRDYLSKITTSSNHLLSLINDVLDMSRIESVKVTYSPFAKHGR